MIESCCLIWKTDDGFKGAYAGDSDQDNPLDFPESDIRFGGTNDFLKIKVNKQRCDTSHYILLIRLKPSASSRYAGAHWLKAPSHRKGVFGGYICTTEKDFNAVQALLVDTFKSSVSGKPKHTIIMTDSTGHRLNSINEPVTVKIGGED
ncbi:MAG: hypothetical protein IKL00_11645 [Oscillospiraceae bacterium]|nr:hypothetical protein [Oscillospiraceae bacterium]